MATKKKNYSIKVDANVAELIDIIGDTVGNGGHLPIRSKNKFFEVLIKSFCYQVLSGKNTFVKDVRSMKKTMNEKGYDENTFKLVTSDALYKYVAFEKEKREIDEMIKLYDSAINKKEKRLAQLNAQIGRLEYDVKQKQANLPQQPTGAKTGVKQANTSNRNKNKPVETERVDKRKNKPKHKYPKANEIDVVYENDEEMMTLTFDEVERYIKLNIDEKAQQAYDYKADDNLLNITPVVYRLLLKIVNQELKKVDVEEVDLTYLLDEYEQIMNDSKTIRDGNIVMDLYVEENIARKEIRERLASIKEKQEQSHQPQQTAQETPQKHYDDETEIEIDIIYYDLNDVEKDRKRIALPIKKDEEINATFVESVAEYVGEEFYSSDIKEEIILENGKFEEMATDFNNAIANGEIPIIKL